MIIDPLIKQEALIMYRAYLIRCLTLPLEDFIDMGRPLSFEEWVEENKNLIVLH